MINSNQLRASPHNARKPLSHHINTHSKQPRHIQSSSSPERSHTQNERGVQRFIPLLITMQKSSAGKSPAVSATTAVTWVDEVGSDSDDNIPGAGDGGAHHSIKDIIKLMLCMGFSSTSPSSSPGGPVCCDSCMATNSKHMTCCKIKGVAVDNSKLLRRDRDFAFRLSSRRAAYSLPMETDLTEAEMIKKDLCKNNSIAMFHGVIVPVFVSRTMIPSASGKSSMIITRDLYFTCGMQTLAECTAADREHALKWTSEIMDAADWLYDRTDGVHCDVGAHTIGLRRTVDSPSTYTAVLLNLDHAHYKVGERVDQPLIKDGRAVLPIHREMCGADADGSWFVSSRYIPHFSAAMIIGNCLLQKQNSHHKTHCQEVWEWINSCQLMGRDREQSSDVYNREIAKWLVKNFYDFTSAHFFEETYNTVLDRLTQALCDSEITKSTSSSPAKVITLVSSKKQYILRANRWEKLEPKKKPLPYRYQSYYISRARSKTPAATSTFRARATTPSRPVASVRAAALAKATPVRRFGGLLPPSSSGRKEGRYHYHQQNRGGGDKQSSKDRQVQPNGEQKHKQFKEDDHRNHQREQNWQSRDEQQSQKKSHSADHKRQEQQQQHVGNSQQQKHSRERDREQPKDHQKDSSRHHHHYTSQDPRQRARGCIDVQSLRNTHHHQSQDRSKYHHRSDQDSSWKSRSRYFRDSDRYNDGGRRYPSDPRLHRHHYQQQQSLSSRRNRSPVKVDMDRSNERLIRIRSRSPVRSRDRPPVHSFTPWSPTDADADGSGVCQSQASSSVSASPAAVTSTVTPATATSSSSSSPSKKKITIEQYRTSRWKSNHDAVMTLRAQQQQQSRETTPVMDERNDGDDEH